MRKQTSPESCELEGNVTHAPLTDHLQDTVQPQMLERGEQGMSAYGGGVMAN